MAEVDDVFDDEKDDALSGLEADAAQAAKITDEDLADLSGLVASWQANEGRIEELEDQLKIAKAQRRKLEFDSIPQKMELLGFREITTSDGAKVKIERVCSGSIPKAKLGQAMSWLRTNGHGSIIKNRLTLDFTKDEDEDAQEAMQLLIGKGFAPQKAESVHASTLASWAREMDGSGEELPLDLLGLFIGDRAKIKES